LHVVYATAGSGNRAPTLAQPANQTGAVNATGSLQLAGSDPDGNALTYSATGLPPALGINASSGLISGTLTSAGTFSVTATVSDGTLSNSKTFTWTVTAGNRAPVLTQPANQTSTVNATVSLQLAGSDPDGNPLTYSAAGLPATLNVNPSTGLISGALSATSAGTYSVTATVSDGALTSSQTFTWTVIDANDHPVDGDYDGDGRADFAVYRNATGIWNIVLSSTSGSLSVRLGQPGDILVPGDYDGDHKTDVAIFRPSTGVWSILKSSANFSGLSVDIPWGQNGDVPITDDYDGDGVTDLTVFRPSNGTWYILTSKSSFTVSIVKN
jgi:hypothetical protein